MIHFAFPNVEVFNNRFIGCGRYVATGEIPGTGYARPTSLIINKPAVEKAAALLAYQPPDSGKIVYEKKDRPNKSYAGESMHLAYLLVLIHRLRSLKKEWAHDIWGTGKIELIDGTHPVLQAVFNEGFQLKLQAFLAQTNDQLFLVPTANMQEQEQAMCRAAQVKVLSIEQYRERPLQETVPTKTVLTIAPDELFALVSLLFQLGDNPYKGLEAFEEEDAGHFFGREELTERIWEEYQSRLNQDSSDLHDEDVLSKVEPGLHQENHENHKNYGSDMRFLAILGPSGSGKSSVVRAGFLPKLQHEPIVFIPGKTPIHTLAKQLAARMTPDNSLRKAKIVEFEDKIKQESIVGLSLIAEERPNDPLLIVVDQFEEVYSLCKDEVERWHFIRNLLYAAQDSAVNVFVLIVLRHDFLSRTWQPQELYQAIRKNQICVDTMTRQEIRRAIVEPAKRAGYLFEETIVDMLMAETERREALPLLEFALTQIWEGLRQGKTAQVTLKAIGGVGGAVAEKADQVYNGLTKPEQRIARRAFLKLADIEQDPNHPTRRRVRIADFVAQGESIEDVHRVLYRFSLPNARLITFSKDGNGQDIVEVAHEALFKQWEQLAAWLETWKDDLPLERRLDKAARRWEEERKPEGLLWRPPDLERLREFSLRWEISQWQQEFFQASERRYLRTQRLKAGAIAGLLFLTVISVIGGIWANSERIRANINEIEVLNQTSDALWLVHDQLSALVANVKAALKVKHADIPGILKFQTTIRLSEHLADIHERNRFQGHAGGVWSVAFSPDGKQLASGSWDATIKLWDLATDKELRTLEGHAGGVISVAFSPDGKQLASGSENATIKLWDLTADKEPRTLELTGMGFYFLTGFTGFTG